MPRVTGETDERQTGGFACLPSYAGVRLEDRRVGEPRVAAPIDFICPELRIGIELVEWIDPAWAQWVNERERFRDQIDQEIDRRGLARFRMGRNESKCTVQVWVTDLPSRGEKERVIHDLVDFVVEFEAHHRGQIVRSRLLEIPNADLPQSLKPHFEGITTFEFPMCDPGVIVTRAGRLDSRTALEALKARLVAKIVNKAEGYLRESNVWTFPSYGSSFTTARPVFFLLRSRRESGGWIRSPNSSRVPLSDRLQPRANRDGSASCCQRRSATDCKTVLLQRLAKPGRRLIKRARLLLVAAGADQMTLRLNPGMLRQTVTLPAPTGNAARGP